MKASHSVVGMFVFGSWSTSLLSWAIRKITGSPWSHTGLGFIVQNGSDRRCVYYEALYGRAVGPARDISHLRKWASEKSGRGFEIIDIDCDAVAAQRKYATAETFVGSVGYGECPLLLMLLHIRCGLRVPPSMGQVVCSEYVARVLFPEYDLRSGDQSFDAVTPEDVRQWAKASQKVTAC